MGKNILCAFSALARHLTIWQLSTLIFDQFDGLQAGEGFILVNDHNPKPLFYQFQAERSGEFSWEHLQEGPETWRISNHQT
jgi:uncharacterized protein (DUF2249 family)